MLLKALDLLRTLGWALIHFIYSLIDGLFDILKGLNAFDIINSVSGDNNFITFQRGVIAIAVTLLGLFAITRFAKKIIDPDEGLSSSGIVKEIVKCGVLIIMSTFLFVQASTFSIKLAGFTSSIFTTNKVTIGDSMLTMFIDYSDGYKECDDFKGENIAKNVSNGNFNGKEMYNDKYVTSKRFILPNKKDYKYKINWIMAVIVGGFFLYSLFFCGMMLARRQIEFLFLFVISPIVFATSVGNKERRSAVVQQLVSLILQGAVIMLIISLTAIVVGQINTTTFFSNTFKDIVIKSILYIGCGSFLLTGSQVVNRFIGGNVSANSGREQLMAMMGFGHSMKSGLVAGVAGTVGVAKIGAGAITGLAGRLGGNKISESIGGNISNYGKSVSEKHPTNSPLNKIGNSISKFGGKVQKNTPSAVGKNMRNSGYRNVEDAMLTMNTSRSMYRRRYRGRDD